MKTISVSELLKEYKSVRALDHISLEVGQGITGLLGPNGAGKTTLLRCLATVLAPDAGEIRVLGLNPERSSERTEVRRRIGYMPQSPGFYRGFTAFEFLDYIGILKEQSDPNLRHSDVRRVLDAVGLRDRAVAKVKDLSGGMKRRLALAQALLGEPHVLILDEPTAGLDPEQRLRFRETISNLADKSAILLSTHQTEDVAALCDRVIVLNAGRVLFEGAPRELIKMAEDKVWVAPDRPKGAVVSWRTGNGSFRGIGDPPQGARMITPELEDAYLLIVGSPAISSVGEIA